MKPAMVTLRLLVVLALALVSGGGRVFARSAAAAGADPVRRVESRTEFFAFGGLYIAASRTLVEIGAHRYDIVADTKSGGIGGILIDLQTHSEAHGTLVDGRLRPRSYSGQVHKNGAASYADVEHLGDGSVAATANPPSLSLRADPPAIARATDQLTAYLTVARQVALGRPCANDIPVFDGRHLYTLHYRDGGSEPLAGSLAAEFAGPIRICRMVREAISGFPDAAGRSEGVYRATIYYAHLKGDQLAVPLHMDLSTEFGPVTARLVELRVDGVAWQVPQ